MFYASLTIEKIKTVFVKLCHFVQNLVVNGVQRGKYTSEGISSWRKL